MFRVGSTALVVKRKTRNNGNTRHTNLSYRVCSLCSVSRRSHRIIGRSSALRHTERSLQLYDYHHDRITQLVIHHHQPESQQLLPDAALALTEPSGGAGLTQL